MNVWFKPLKSQPTEHSIMAFDIEGAGGPAGFVCGTIVSGYTYNFFVDRAEMWECLKEYARAGFWIFSHNLEYDLPILTDDELWRGDLIFTKGGILYAEYHHRDKKIRFYDSANLFPRWSIASIGDMINLPKLKLPEKIMQKLAHGDHWTSFDLFEQKKVEKYCARDSEIVYRAIMTMQELTLNLGGELHATIAGIAMDVYRRKFLKWPWPAIGPETNRTARQAYYGGRTENFAYGRMYNAQMYDVTSLYPYVQSKLRFPHPRYLTVDVTPRPAGEWWNWEGVANVTVKIPDTFIPPLPYRHEDRLFFPTGIVESTWTIWELREALLRGVQLQEVHWVIGSKTTFNPFVDYVDQLFGLRNAYLDEHSPKANLVKLILNSLYGRFGIDTDQGLMRMMPILSDTDLEPLHGWVTREIGGYLVAVGQIDTMRYPPYANAFFAAQIASAARIQLLDALELQGERSAYCDTDSIITSGTMETSDQLGGWREETKNATVDLHGPKEYVLYEDLMPPKYVVKGIPHYEAEQYIHTGKANFYRAVSIREAINRNLEPADWARVFYTRRMNYPKRMILNPFAMREWEFTSTRPWHYSELPHAVEQQQRVRGLWPIVPKPLYPDVPLQPPTTT